MIKSATWFSQYLFSDPPRGPLAADQHAPERITLSSVSPFPKRKKKVTNLLEQKLIKLQGAREVVLSKSVKEARALLFHYLTVHGNNILNLNSSTLLQESDKWENKGITVRLINSFNVEEIENNIDDKTSLIYLESINQDNLDITALLKIYVIAREYKIPVVADNSHGHLGALIRPTIYGINFVIEEAASLWSSEQNEFNTVISEGQPFEWNKIKHPRLTDAYKKYRDKHPDKKHSDSSLLEIILSEKNEEVREISAELSSQVHEKIDTLQNQVIEYSKHTLQLAEFLYQLQYIRFVHYAGLKSSSNHFSALTYLRNGFGNELAFETNSSELDRSVQEIFSRNKQWNFSYRYNPDNQWHYLKIRGAQAQEILELFYQVSDKWIEHSKKRPLPWNLDYSI